MAARSNKAAPSETEERPSASFSDVASALAASILEAPSLVKEGENKFAGYRYTSIDVYYEMIAKVAAKNGLTLVSREVSFDVIEVMASPEKRGGGGGAPQPRSMAKTTYECDAYLAGFEPLRGISRITVLHGITGPQTAGSSASYAEKVFFRVLLKAVTGEPDGDAEEPHTVHPAPNAFPGEKPAPAAKPATPPPAENRAAPRAAPPPPPPPPPEPQDEGPSDDPIQTTSLDGAADLTRAILAAKSEIERVEARKYPVFRKRPENVDLIIDVIAATVPHLGRLELKEFWDLNSEFLTAMKEGDVDNYKRITPIFQKRLEEAKKEEAGA